MLRLVTTVVATFAVVAGVAWLLSRTVSVTDDGSVTQTDSSMGSNARTVRLVLDVPDKEDRYVITRTTDVPRAVFHAHLADRTADMAGGSDVPLVVRPIPALTPTFYVPEMGVRGGTLQIDETGGQPGDYRVLTVADFEAEQSTARVLFGLYFGLLLAVGVYHVLMFAVLGGLDFLTYGLYMGALLLQEVARTEYIDVLLPGVAVDHHAVFMLSIALLAVAGYAFFNTFLQLSKTQPALNRILAIFAGVEVLAAVVAARIGDARLDGAVVLFAFVTLAVGLTGAIRALALGERSARFLLLAYSGFAIGLIATVLRRFVPGLPEWTGLGFELGTAFEALTLALGVGDRIVSANEERDQARVGRLEEQRTLTVAYARFVPEAFLHMLGKSDVRMVELGDRASRRTTVLFTDVRSFSTLSEAMEPEETFGFVNELLSRTGPIIRAHDGIVDKYIGDAIMALFPGGVEDALDAAFSMQAAIAALNRVREQTGHEPIAMGIGVHIGDVVLGIVGEIERMDGTAIGDAVNLASRLEGLTKIYGSAIIISDDAAGELAPGSREDLRYLGRIAVKGKNVPVGLFEALAAETMEQRDEKLRTRPMFEAGVEALTRGDFALAAQCFDAVIMDNPMDGPATHLAERSRELELRPEHWAGFDHALEK
jgi:two-component system, sensor histidine kinase LadS